MRDIRVRFRLELPCGCVRSHRALPAQILIGTRDVSDPLWNALGVNLRGQPGGRSRLAHGTIRRLGRQKAPPSYEHPACAEASKALERQRFTNEQSALILTSSAFSCRSPTAPLGDVAALGQCHPQRHPPTVGELIVGEVRLCSVAARITS